MTQKPLPIGVDDFEQLITNGYYFVDKTMFIQELIDKKGLVNLFTRPRRFGKSLNMSMLRYFFEDGRDLNGDKVEYAYLFEGLNISRCDDRYQKYMGKYPVIMLSLKSAKQAEFQDSYTMLARMIAEEFKRHRFIIGQQKLESERERYASLMSEQADMGSYRDSLRFLSECLHTYYGKTVSYTHLRAHETSV